jgi:hypothetical protein
VTRLRLVTHSAEALPPEGQINDHAPVAFGGTRRRLRVLRSQAEPGYEVSGCRAARDVYGHQGASASMVISGRGAKCWRVSVFLTDLRVRGIISRPLRKREPTRCHDPFKVRGKGKGNCRPVLRET